MRSCNRYGTCRKRTELVALVGRQVFEVLNELNQRHPVLHGSVGSAQQRNPVE
jgi:hypothetical protein